MGKNILQTNQQLIEIYRKVHGELYDYSLLNYTYPRREN